MKKQILMSVLAGVFALTSASAQFAASPAKGKGGYGPGNGAGYNGSGPKDGTGYGAKAGKRNGTGTCDRTGPNGTQRAPQGRSGRR